MAEFTGTHQGYSYSASWDRVDAGHLVWNAIIHTSSGNWCGNSTGTIYTLESTDATCEARVRLAIDAEIESGLEHPENAVG